MDYLEYLLNEYEPYIASDGEHQENIRLYRAKSQDKTVRDNAIRYILSKEYLFIDWLIREGKIDNIKLIDLVAKDDCVVSIKFEEDSQKVKVLLLMLAISDNPLDDLISVLKD